MRTNTTRRTLQHWGVVLPFLLVASIAVGQQSQGSPSGKIPPRLIFSPDPDYPAEATQKGIKGKVYLKVEVLPDGTTNNVRVVKSLDPGLDRAVVETVTHWRFQPSTNNGTPVLMEVNVVVETPDRLSLSPAPGNYTGLPCVEKIDSREVKDLLKKASKGNHKAQVAVGCAYEYGAAGLAKDRAQAILWYGRAAESGLVPAQYFLGETYLSSFDFVHAYAWLKIADSGGYKDPSDKLKVVKSLLTADQLTEAEAQVTEWKRNRTAK